MADIRETLAERGNRYGRFEDHARIAQNIQQTMQREGGWELLRPDARQALTVIADKIARMLNGDPEYDDNWRDIVGYAQLVLDRIQGTGPYYAGKTVAPITGTAPVTEPPQLEWHDYPQGALEQQVYRSKWK